VELRIPLTVDGTRVMLFCLLGVIGLELASYVFLREDSGVWYEVEVAAEEFLEMAGTSVILYAILLLATKVTSP
jgi:hypothetical protein